MSDDISKRRAAVAEEARHGQITAAAMSAMRAALEGAPGATRILVVVEVDSEEGTTRGLAGWPQDMGTQGLGEALCGAGIACIDAAATKEGT